MWVGEEKMNVFVKERAHQSETAWCLHQSVPGTPHPSITQQVPQRSEREKDFRLMCHTKSLVFKKITHGTLSVPWRKKIWKKEKMLQKVIIWNFRCQLHNESLSNIKGLVKHHMTHPTLIYEFNAYIHTHLLPSRSYKNPSNKERLRRVWLHCWIYQTFKGA